jgi:hypothetical protein
MKKDYEKSVLPKYDTRTGDKKGKGDERETKKRN